MTERLVAQIRLRPCFSPGESRVASRGEVLAACAAVPGRRLPGSITIPTPTPHTVATAHLLAAALPLGPLIQMPLQQQPVLLTRIDLQTGFQLPVPGTHRLRTVQPGHHRLQMLPSRPSPPSIPSRGLPSV